MTKMASKPRRGDMTCDLNATAHVIYYKEGNADILNQYITFCLVFNAQVKRYGYSEQAAQVHEQHIQIAPIVLKQPTDIRAGRIEVNENITSVSLPGKVSTIKLFPTRRAPSIKRALSPWRLCFQSSNFSVILRLIARFQGYELVQVARKQDY